MNCVSSASNPVVWIVYSITVTFESPFSRQYLLIHIFQFYLNCSAVVVVVVDVVYSIGSWCIFISIMFLLLDVSIFVLLSLFPHVGVVILFGSLRRIPMLSLTIFAPA